MRKEITIRRCNVRRNRRNIDTISRILKVPDIRQNCVPVVPDTFEEVETLPESQFCRVFPEHHIVTTTRRNEYNRRNVVETLYPFSSFITLATDVEHTARTKKYSIKYLIRTSRIASILQPRLGSFGGIISIL